MTDEGARAIAIGWMDEVWNRRDLASFEALHAPDFVDHSPAGRGADRAAYAAGIADLFAAFPDFAATIDDLVVDEADGKAAIRWSATGTHCGMFLGAESTGRTIRFRGIEIIRAEGGRIVERWGEWDEFELMHQLDPEPLDATF